MKKTLEIAVWRYDRTQALYDGRVTLPGYDLRMIDEPLEQIFAKAFTTAEYQVSELSFSNFLRACVNGHCTYSGIPIFPSRSFRHGAIYVRKDGPVREPRDLIGRRIGVREYSMTAALAARGALREQFGIEPDQMTWVVGDVDRHERHEIVLPTLHRSIPIEAAPPGVLLDDLLRQGRIDAILAYKPFKSATGPSATARRLFEDNESVEKEFFAATGIFPIMHLIGLRRKDDDADPALAGLIYQAFARAQHAADEDLSYEQALKIGLPWLRNEVERTRKVMTQNFWPCGFDKNRKTIAAMIDWSFKDGLIPRRIDPEQVFLAKTLAT